MEHKYMKVTGVGFQLPDIFENKICDTKERFWEIVSNGECVLSPVTGSEEYGIRIFGKIHDLNIYELNIAEKHKHKYAQATLIGAMAVKKAIEDAGYTVDELSNDRTMLIVSSTMLTLENIDKQYQNMYSNGLDAVGFDFYIQGTPGSIASGISSLLKLDCPIFSMTGSCSVSQQALQVAYEKMQLGLIDKAIILGVDDTNDPLYFSSATHLMKNGQTINSLSDDPKSVKPHDKNASGNSCGQGAIALILENNDSQHKCAYNTKPFQIYYKNSRKTGHSIFDCGEPSNFAVSMQKLLSDANLDMKDIGFINDFSEGAGFIEDFFVDVISKIRSTLNYDGEILVTNQEAAFGHIGGVAGLCKFISNLMMLTTGIIGPSINAEEKPEKLEATPVIGKPIENTKDNSIIISCGAGGDCTISLIRI